MKEMHLQIGSIEVFKQRMKDMGVITENTSETPRYLGLKIILNGNIPPEKAFLVGPDGLVLKVFNLNTIN